MLFLPKDFKTQWHHRNATFTGFHTCGAENHLRQGLQLFHILDSVGNLLKTWFLPLGWIQSSSPGKL